MPQKSVILKASMKHGLVGFRVLTKLRIFEKGTQRGSLAIEKELMRTCGVKGGLRFLIGLAFAAALPRVMNGIKDQLRVENL